MKRLTAGILLMMAFSCEKVPQTSQGWYQRGIGAYYHRDWGKSADSLKKALENGLPSNQESTAKLYLADAYFNEGDYENAALEYEEFTSLYPASPKFKRALFRLGICYLNLIKGPQWDQEFTRKAIKTFDNLISRYPNDTLSDKAKVYRNMARQVLAEHIIYIGGTYDMLHKFTASARRYGEVNSNYLDVEKPDRVEYLLGRSLFYTFIQANNEIGKLKSKLNVWNGRLKSGNGDEKRVAENRVKLIRTDIANWQKLSAENKKKGKMILANLISKFSSSRYAGKAREILAGKMILNVEPVFNPIKHSTWWKIKETI